MNTDYIIISEYCIRTRIEPDFIIQLADEGLIEITVIEDNDYLHISQLRNIEQYANWYYDLSINVEGIDVVQNLLNKMHNMQNEISRLKQQLRLID